jgi:hypothetical protein
MESLQFRNQQVSVLRVSVSTKEFLKKLLSSISAKIFIKKVSTKMCPIIVDKIIRLTETKNQGKS